MIAAAGPREALYDLVIAKVFLAARSSRDANGAHPFTKVQVATIIDEMVASKVLSKGIKNIPDIKYTYDARRDFPASIAKHGYWAIIGQGKGRYAFVKLAQNNLIRVPKDLPKPPKLIKVKDRTPPIVARVLGTDEQAALTRIRYNDLLAQFTGLAAVHHVQPHERTTVVAGQIEVDEICVGEDKHGKGYVIPISGKGGGKDNLSYSQALNLNLYAAEKARYNGLTSRPLGVTRGPDGSVYVVEFSTDRDIANIRIVRSGRYIFV